MMPKPENCCDCGTYEHSVPMCIGRCKVVEVDYCISRLVGALEASGLRPVASCCGHGKMPPSVLLEDDMEVVLLTREQADETVKRYCTRTDLPQEEFPDLDSSCGP
jgi:hypothetical protein